MKHISVVVVVVAVVVVVIVVIMDHNNTRIDCNPASFLRALRFKSELGSRGRGMSRNIIGD